MKLPNIKRLAMVSAVALGVALTSGQAFAQGTETVDITFTTQSSFTVTDGVNMDMGSWFTVIRNGDTITLNIDDTGALTNSALTDSIVVDLTGGPGTAGTVLVQFPLNVDGFVITMTVDGYVDFADAGLTLSQVYWSGIDDGGVAQNDVAIGTGALGGPATQDVQIVLGGPANEQTYTFGADVDVSVTPADGPQTASFTVDFDY